MNCSVGEYIVTLLTREGISQADLARELHVPRQLLCYIIGGKRTMSLQLAMKLEAFFSLPEGELTKMQALQAVRLRKQELRDYLCKKLIANNAFWSYKVTSLSDIPDEAFTKTTTISWIK